MKKLITIVAVAVAAVAAAAVAYAAGENEPAAKPHTHTITMRTSDKAADLRVTLDRLLGEHALLAVAATQRGLQGGKEFPALAKALDRNSVELANAIGSVYGTKARNQFLNGKFLWRAHIGFFVDYTVATAKKDPAGQKRAVNNLKTYIGAFSAFLAGATGLPQKSLAAGITDHVMQLKGSLDAYAAGDYAKSYALAREAYLHMIMTGDALSGAIAKQFPKRFGA
jgi:hypothetical protein